MAAWRQRDLALKAEINVTSLVDIAFTLLVIFIIVAPALQGGIEIDVPEGEADPIEAEDNTLIISVDRDNVVYIGETPVSREEFRATFSQMVEAVRPDKVIIRADSLSMWGAGIDVVTTVDDLDLKFAIQVEQRPER